MGEVPGQRPLQQFAAVLACRSGCATSRPSRRSAADSRTRRPPRSRRSPGSSSRRTTVVVPRSMASPWIGPRPRSISLAVQQDPVAVAGDRGIERQLLAAGRAAARRGARCACRRAASCGSGPRRSPATTRQRHERRKFSRRCSSSGALAERHSIPSVISTRHSLHLPCLRHEVGTLTPSVSAQSNSDGPGATRVCFWLKCNSTLMQLLVSFSSGREHNASTRSFTQL